MESDEEDEVVSSSQQLPVGSSESIRESITPSNAVTTQKSKPKMNRRLSSAVHVPISNLPDELTDQQKVELKGLISKFPEPPTVIISEPSAPVFSLTAMKAASSGWMRGWGFGSPGSPSMSEPTPTTTNSSTKSNPPTTTTVKQTVV